MKNLTENKKYLIQSEIPIKVVLTIQSTQLIQTTNQICKMQPITT